jgi:hypothetical protein
MELKKSWEAHLTFFRIVSSNRWSQMKKNEEETVVSISSLVHVAENNCHPLQQRDCGVGYDSCSLNQSLIKVPLLHLMKQL